MFEKWGRSDGPYKIKYTTVLGNLKNPKIPDFRRKILIGPVKPETVVNMSGKEMASDKMLQLYQQWEEEKALNININKRVSAMCTRMMLSVLLRKLETAPEDGFTSLSESTAVDLIKTCFASATDRDITEETNLKIVIVNVDGICLEYMELKKDLSFLESKLNTGIVL
ncbi:hypothetical protein WN944_013442 [Citrus x changshan-huyou]|uniref:TFIIS central domain-containing protein n=1 Tax=Citrus x changshan-huyou TaxID=2935761 RepID=A0AAP0QHY0_9ROSI